MELGLGNGKPRLYIDVFILTVDMVAKFHGSISNERTRGFEKGLKKRKKFVQMYPIFKMGLKRKRKRKSVQMLIQGVKDTDKSWYLETWLQEAYNKFKMHLNLTWVPFICNKFSSNCCNVVHFYMYTYIVLASCLS